MTKHRRRGRRAAAGGPPGLAMGEALRGLDDFTAKSVCALARFAQLWILGAEAHREAADARIHARIGGEAGTR